MTTFVGIDPGKDGAVAQIAQGVLSIRTTPTIKMGSKRQYDVLSMVDMLKCIASPKVMLELVAARPGQGVVSMFSMGEGLGLWRGILVSLGIPHQLVVPQTWRKTMLAGIVADADPKAGALIQAQRLFPSVSFKGPRGGVLDGHADAALLADYSRRILG